MQWILYSRDGEAVATVFLPDDTFPDVVDYKGRLFAYDYPRGEFVEADVVRIP
jgi:hypothetical protein